MVYLCLVVNSGTLILMVACSNLRNHSFNFSTQNLQINAGIVSPMGQNIYIKTIKQYTSNISIYYTSSLHVSTPIRSLSGLLIE